MAVSLGHEYCIEEDAEFELLYYLLVSFSFGHHDKEIYIDRSRTVPLIAIDTLIHETQSVAVWVNGSSYWFLVKNV